MNKLAGKEKGKFLCIISLVQYIYPENFQYNQKKGNDNAYIYIYFFLTSLIYLNIERL